MVPRTLLDVDDKRSLPLLGIEPRFLGRPARNIVSIQTALCRLPYVRSSLFQNCNKISDYKDAKLPYQCGILSMHVVSFVRGVPLSYNDRYWGSPEI